ncbi:hypothetical protein BSKO_03338 [Bryopsis sp. KO-2023]|nr:hypothetical protein BSKO_03338 [Bryopsis sp. KO-2023]
MAGVECGACKVQVPLSEVVSLAGCSCLVCNPCLTTHVSNAINLASRQVVETTFQKAYPVGQRIRYIDDQGDVTVGIICKRNWSEEDWARCTLTIRNLGAEESFSIGIWRVVPASRGDAVPRLRIPGLPRVICPGSCSGAEIDGAYLRRIAPDAVTHWDDRCFEASALLSNLVRCPNGSCGALIERVGCGTSTPPISAIPENASPRSKYAALLRERYRYRCARCGKDFCGVCLEQPYHDRYNCRENRAPQCRFCDNKVLDCPSLEGKRSKELRKLAKERGVDVSWCLYKAELKRACRLACETCVNPACAEKVKTSCTKILACGHDCCGVRGEPRCPPCIEPGCASAESDGTMDCQICWEALRSGPCVQIACGHIFHLSCARERIVQGFPGPEISFNFMCCPLCGSREGHSGGAQTSTGAVAMDHCMLALEIKPALELRNDVAKLAKKRLKLSGELRRQAELQPGGEYEGRPVDYALRKYLYFQCHRCKKPYFGGERVCQNGQRNQQEFKVEDLVCGGCAALASGNKCEIHGTSGIEWKCRFCCSVALWFCWGTTHMCDKCHSLCATTGPRKIGCRSVESCPLGIKHPPPGEEFCLGCSLCRFKDVV